MDEAKIKSVAERGSTKVVMLDEPIQYGETVFDKVLVRRPTTGDVGKLDRSVGPEALKNVALILCDPDGKGLPFKVLEEMDAVDGFKIVEAAQEYLARHFPQAAKASFAGGGHSTTIPLQCPIEFNGRVFEHVVVRRLTANEFQTYFDSPPDQRGRLPAFVDDNGKPLPDAVLAAVSFDDNEAIMQAFDVFIPRVLKVARAPDPSSAPQAGEVSPQP